MNEPINDDTRPVDLKTGGAGILVGSVATAIVMMFSGKQMDQATIQTAIDSLTVQGKICELVEVSDKLAQTSDSIRPAYKKIYPAREIYDSLGKVVSIIKEDTVTVDASPILSGFNENGVSDYSMGTLVSPDSGLRISFIRIQTGKEINSQIIQPKSHEFKIEFRGTSSLH